MKDYQYYIKRIGEYGYVREVYYPIAKIVGLPYVKPDEIVVFETNQQGQVFSLAEDHVEVLLFSDQPVPINSQVTRTDSYVSIPFDEAVLGTIIDPLGRSFFDQSGLKESSHSFEVDRDVRGIADRVRIQRPLLSGTSLVDLLIPLGKGQRELVIGDRKTGKSSFLLTLIKKQIEEGSVVVYAAIGKKKSDIKKLQEFFEKEQLSHSCLIVASDPFDSPSLIFLTPYTALSAAEYFSSLGRDVVLVFDDLSTHAKFYREMALLSGRFPGRDSYPGDIFFIHAKLLERGGNFKHPKKGEVSISILPVVETIEADLTGFIATNIMGMTDGHVFFDSDAYYKGRRPAVNISLSVTRVGRQTQTPLKREINREITAFLANFEKMQTFSHFGAELSEKVKTILKTGDRMQSFFDQHYTTIVPEEVQLILISLIWLHTLDELPLEKIAELRIKLIEQYKDEAKGKEMKEMMKSDTFHDHLLKVTKKKQEYLALIGVKPQAQSISSPAPVTPQQATSPTGTPGQTQPQTTIQPTIPPTQSPQNPAEQEGKEQPQQKQNTSSAKENKTDKIKKK